MRREIPGLEESDQALLWGVVAREAREARKTLISSLAYAPSLLIGRPFSFALACS